MLDINLLRLITNKKDYYSVLPALQASCTTDKMRRIVKEVQKYYKAYDHDEIDPALFIPAFHRCVLANMSEDDADSYKKTLASMFRVKLDDTTRAGVLNSVLVTNFASHMKSTLDKYSLGDEVDLLGEVTHYLEACRAAATGDDLGVTNDGIDDLLEAMGTDHGIRFRLACINKYMRPLVYGDFGVIAARPDQGKSSFIASELTYMAPQIKEDRPVLWACNEGTGAMIKFRLMQAALGITSEELKVMHAAGTLYHEYDKAIGGRGKIIVAETHGFSAYKIEQLIQYYNPAIVVHDMLDNTRANTAGGDRKDLQLEGLYQWARECCVKYQHIGLATSQISDEGKDERFPGLSCLKDSKTGKQGACEFQLMIGSRETDPASANTRWLSLAKNKLSTHTGGELRHEVHFDRARARYEEYKES